MAIEETPLKAFDASKIHGFSFCEETPRGICKL